jgi:hypothetical protein
MQSKGLNDAMNQNPGLEEEMLKLCADSDTICRYTRDIQNTKGRFLDSKQAAEDAVKKSSSSSMDRYT